MSVVKVLLLAALCPSTALVVQPALRTAAPAASRVAQPQMMLGSRSIGRVIRSVKMPSFPTKGGRSGSIRGCDGGAGSPPTDSGASMSAPEPEDESNPFAMAWKGYEALLEEKPLLMKGLTSLTGFALGDILAQLFIQKTDPFDFARLFRLASFGFLVHGTTSHWFYDMLDGKIPGTSAKVVFTKVFIDQVIWNPIFGVMFFCYLGVLEAKGVQYVIDKTKNDLINAVTGSWKVWPLAHTINFRFVPSSQRVLYINTIQIGYNCFLSILGSKSEE
jgi:protein Mpv17